MKNTTKSGIIVLVIMIIAVTGYSIYTIKGQDNYYGNALQSTGSSYRVAATSETYDPIAAKNYKNEFIAALYIEGTIQEENDTYNQKWLMSTIHGLKDNKKNVAIALVVPYIRQMKFTLPFRIIKQQAALFMFTRDLWPLQAVIIFRVPETRFMQTEIHSQVVSV